MLVCNGCHYHAKVLSEPLCRALKMAVAKVGVVHAQSKFTRWITYQVRKDLAHYKCNIGRRPYHSCEVATAGQLRTKCINACLCPVGSLDGCSVVTVEGLGNAQIGFNAVQGDVAPPFDQ